MLWNSDNTIIVDPPKRPKKITGTRLGAILGVNRWSTPFEAWCAITRNYEKPFEDTKYTLAGKAIEPLQARFIEETYGISLTAPADIWGKDYFKKTYGDFFPETKIFGGMWDYLEKEDGETVSVFEMKTTKRAEDWAEDIPEYYAIQAALYAYLLGVDQVYMVCSILKDEDYDEPENYVCDMSNTIVRPFKVSERYPDMHDILTQATHWWNRHVKKGISPKYDEEKDAEILAELRKNNVSPDSDLDALVAEAESLSDRIDSIKAIVADDEKRLKKVLEMIKDLSVDQFRDGDKQVVVSGGRYDWVTSRSVSVKIDKKKMEADGILEDYSTEETSYRLTKKERK